MYPGLPYALRQEKASENGCKDRKIQDCFRFSVQKRFRLQHCVIEFGDIHSMENLVMRFRRSPKRNQQPCSPERTNLPAQDASPARSS